MIEIMNVSNVNDLLDIVNSVDSSIGRHQLSVYSNKNRRRYDMTIYFYEDRFASVTIDGFIQKHAKNRHPETYDFRFFMTSSKSNFEFLSIDNQRRVIEAIHLFKQDLF